MTDQIKTAPLDVPGSSALPIAVLSVLAAMGTLATNILLPSLPQIAIEHGRKMIGPGERPSIDVVENETIAGAAAKSTATEQVAKAGARA